MSSPLAAELHRSDHASFWKQDFPGLMISDTADYRNPFYHCGFGPDAPNTLDPAFATSVVRATVAAVVDVLGLPLPEPHRGGGATTKVTRWGAPFP